MVKENCVFFSNTHGPTGQNVKRKVTLIPAKKLFGLLPNNRCVSSAKKDKLCSTLLTKNRLKRANKKI